MDENEIAKLLTERNSQYGNSFYATDRAISAMVEGDASLLQALLNAGCLSNWVIMMSKMNRAIFSPLKEDHWKDIAGYANLNLRILRGEVTPDLLNQAVLTQLQIPSPAQTQVYVDENNNPEDRATILRRYRELYQMFKSKTTPLPP